MKQFVSAVIFLFFVFTNPANSGGNMEYTIQGNRFIFQRGSVLNHNGSYADKLWRGILTQDTFVKVGKYKAIFKKNTEVEFSYNSVFSSGYLANDTEFTIKRKKLIFAKGKILRFDERGNISKGYLANHTIFQMGKNRIAIKKGVNEIEAVEFYPSGALRQGFLAGNAACQAGNFNIQLFKRIGFYENGNLEWGSLFKDAALNIRGNIVKFYKGEYYQITFYNSGAVQEGYLSGQTKFNLDGTELNFEYRLSFYENGLPLRGTLAAPLVYKGKTIGQGKTITLKYDTKGKLLVVQEYKFPSR